MKKKTIITICAAVGGSIVTGLTGFIVGRTCHKHSDNVKAAKMNNETAAIELERAKLEVDIKKHSVHLEELEKTNNEARQAEKLEYEALYNKFFGDVDFDKINTDILSCDNLTIEEVTALLDHVDDIRNSVLLNNIYRGHHYYMNNAYFAEAKDKINRACFALNKPNATKSLAGYIISKNEYDAMKAKEFNESQKLQDARDFELALKEAEVKKAVEVEKIKGKNEYNLRREERLLREKEMDHEYALSKLNVSASIDKSAIIGGTIVGAASALRNKEND